MKFAPQERQKETGPGQKERKRERKKERKNVY